MAAVVRGKCSIYGHNLFVPCMHTSPPVQVNSNDVVWCSQFGAPNDLWWLLSEAYTLSGYINSIAELYLPLFIA